jgi:hypothetical protein
MVAQITALDGRIVGSGGALVRFLAPGAKSREDPTQLLRLLGLTARSRAAIAREPNLGTRMEGAAQ